MLKNNAYKINENDNVAVTAGSIIDGGRTVREVGQEIFNLTLRVADGQQTCAEINR